MHWPTEGCSKAGLGLALFMMVSGQALAMGVGEWKVRSYLGERLVAEAEVFHEASELIDPECFRLSSPGTDADFTALQNPQLGIQSSAKGVKLRITTDRSVADPIVQTRLEIRCGVSQTRDVLLFLTPREVAQAQAVATPLAAGTSASLAPPATETQSRRPQAVTSAAADSPASSPARNASRKPASAASANKESPRTTRRAPASGQGTSAPKLVLSQQLDPEIVERLKLSHDLRRPPREASQEEREQLRRLYRSMMYLADLKDGRTGAPRPDLPEGMPQGEAGLLPMMEGVRSGASVHTLASSASGSDSQEPPAQPESTPLAPLENWNWGAWWIPALILLLLALLLGLLLARNRRSKNARELPEALEPMPPIHSVKLRSENDHGAEDTLETLLKRESEAAPSKSAARDSQDSHVGLGPIHGVTVHAESQSFTTSYRTMLDLAESMMAFGLVSDATDALKEYIEDHPQVAVEPWLKLLDVLRQSGKRTEFEQYSLKLRQNFNLEIPGWDAVQADTTVAEQADAEALDERFLAAPSPLEAFPHVRDRIVSLWGTADCGVYLQHLLRDNRDGKRRGFPLFVVDDILLLIDITEYLTGTDSEASIRERPEIFSDTW